MAFFRPDRYFRRLTDVDLHTDILDAGFTALLLDVDNTLLPRDGGEVPADIEAWVGAAKDAGLAICLHSNNWHQPVHDCAGRLRLPLVHGGVKPLPFAFAAALRRIGADRKSTLCIGDQLVTDVWGAHGAGIRVFLLTPLSETDLWHTQLLRHIERGILRNEQPEGKDHHGENAVTG